MSNEVMRNDTRRRSSKQAVFEALSGKWVLAVLTIVPALLLFAFVNIVPIFWAITGSFYEISAYSPEWTFTGVQHYADVLANPELWASLSRSVVFASGAVTLQLVLGIGIAMLINRPFKGATFIRAIVLLPYLTPTAIVSFIALWMANSQFGIINQILAQMGLIETYIPWFASLDFAMIAVILTSAWKWTIFVTIMVLARLQSIPDGLYEAAEVAGATKYQLFRDVTLPNIKGVIFIVVLLRGLWMFNKFDIIYVLTQGGPRSITETAPIYAYEVAFVETQLGKSAAISTLLFVMLVTVAVIYFKTLEPEQEVRVE